MKPTWKGNKLQLNGVTIAEVKPYMENTFKVVLVERPDLGPSQLGYLSVEVAKEATERGFLL